MDNNYTTGGYTDAWCTKCNLELGHTIIAMVDNAPKRVKCNTCDGEHNFRAHSTGKRGAKLKSSDDSDAGTSSTGVSAMKLRSMARKQKLQEANYNEQVARLTGGDLSVARKYNAMAKFKKDEVIDHPKFGVGVVVSLVPVNKMEILFIDGPKLLVQNMQVEAQ